METIALFIKLLIIALAALTVVHYSGLVGKLKYFIHQQLNIPLAQIRLRPIDCHVCLSFWLSVLYFITESLENHPLHTADIVQIFVYGLAASAISTMVYKMFR